jgi:peptidoglycan/LPS O-acetylase OafA/YrhL
LEHPAMLKVGALSYSLYLLHNLAPLLAGHLVAFLWGPSFESALGAALRILVFALLSRGLAAASWKWIEQPVDRLRNRFG